MAVNVTDTVGANNTIILDSTSKIPAIDGSQITSLSGVAFTTGTIPVARLDIGTSAGKIVQLDGSAKIPALNGSNLTGLGPTKSTSDPTISTNPSGGVGTKWVNKSSGEIYICTDATAGANVWRNVGAGTDDIKPWAYQGEIAGFASGGHNGSTAVQTYVFSSATTAASSHGNLNSRGNMRFLVGVSSETHGYTMGGGGGGAQNYADKFAFASNTTATSLGSNPLPWANTDRAATAWTQTHGYFATGEVPGPLGARHPTIVPFQSYETSDGHIIIAAGNDSLFNTLCKTLECDSLSRDNRFDNNEARGKHIKELQTEFEKKLKTKPTEEWLKVLIPAGIPCAPINNVAQALSDPQILARNMVIETTAPEGGSIKMAGNPIKFSNFEDPKIRPAAPDLDQDRQNILKDFKK